MQTTQSHIRSQVEQAKEAGIKHTSTARFSSEESVVAEASLATVLRATCRQSAPIRRALHCVDDEHSIAFLTLTMCASSDNVMWDSTYDRSRQVTSAPVQFLSDIL